VCESCGVCVSCGVCACELCASCVCQLRVLVACASCVRVESCVIVVCGVVACTSNRNTGQQKRVVKVRSPFPLQSFATFSFLTHATSRNISLPLITWHKYNRCRANVCAGVVVEANLNFYYIK
jgi:hypothetical protein